MPKARLENGWHCRSICLGRGQIFNPSITAYVYQYLSTCLSLYGIVRLRLCCTHQYRNSFFYNVGFFFYIDDDSYKVDVTVLVRKHTLSIDIGLWVLQALFLSLTIMVQLL